MNDTMMSQIVWVMLLTHQCLPKVSKNCQKKPKVQVYFSSFLQKSNLLYFITIDEIKILFEKNQPV